MLISRYFLLEKLSIKNMNVMKDYKNAMLLILLSFKDILSCTIMFIMQMREEEIDQSTFGKDHFQIKDEISFCAKINRHGLKYACFILRSSKKILSRSLFVCLLRTLRPYLSLGLFVRDRHFQLAKIASFSNFCSKFLFSVRKFSIWQSNITSIQGGKGIAGSAAEV